MITISQLSKKYDQKEVLKNVNLQFDKGHVYGIMGENGAGKTTLFRCIAGLEPYEGNVTSDFTPLKHHLGLLETDPYFFSKITGREYIQLLLNAREKLDPEGASLNLDDHNIFDLPLDQFASTYSTGMKKKLALQAILLQKNEYYILDEPFNGVDIQSNILITEIIHQLKEKGRTIIISSHIFSTLKDTCSQIYLLESGTVSRSFSPEMYSQLENEMRTNVLSGKARQIR